MLSYKKWKKVNESFDMNLGIKTPGKIGELHSKWDEMGMTMPSSMMKLNKSKKMFGGDEGPEMGAGMDSRLGGGGDDMPFSKKKKPMPRPDEDEDDDAHLDDEDPDMDDDMDGDEDDDMGGDLGGEDMPHDEDDLEAPKPLKGKKSNLVDRAKEVADGAKMMHGGVKKMVKGMKESKECACGGKCSKCKKMTKEQVEFYRSLASQTGSTKFARDDTGAWQPVAEDSVIPPTDPNANITEDDPQPGEVGYAPQGRLGFTEWAEKYKRPNKK